ncbi:MAG: DUF4426 domain-containing protein [Pseudomonadota bacterium]
MAHFGKHALVSTIRFAVLAWTLLIGASAANAESQDFDNYTVHYIAVGTTFLTPEIAEQYNIVRSNRRAFLNIAVIRNNPDGSTTPVAATVTGGKSNLLQQSGDIAFAEIREGEAIYYIGQFDFSNAETIRLNVDVQPELKGAVHEIEWTTQLYADEL